MHESRSPRTRRKGGGVDIRTVARIADSIAAGVSALGPIMLWRIPRCPLDSSGAGVVRHMSIIIPARNEEGNLPRLLRSLALQTITPRQVIVVDDYSEDATAERAGDFDVTVMRPPAKPSDWTGKTWACYQGARAADSEYLLFLDADVWLETDGLQRLGSAMARCGGIVSVQPYHQTQTFAEQFSSFFHIMMMSGIGAFSMLGNRLTPAGLFGQCLLCRRYDYFAAGGHREARGEVLENLSLGVVFRQRALPIHLYGGQGTLNVRMYPQGFRALIDGWSKAFVNGAGASNPGMLVVSACWIAGCCVATAALCIALRFRTPRSLLSYPLYVVQIAWILRRLGSFRRSTAFLFPLHCLFFCCTFAYSAVRVNVIRSVQWRGRSVHGKPRGGRKP